MMAWSCGSSPVRPPAHRRPRVKDHSRRRGHGKRCARLVAVAGFRLPPAGLATPLAFAAGFCRAAGVSGRRAAALMVVVEELATNALSHGSRGRRPLLLGLSLRRAGGRLELRYEDDGRAFDPRAAASVVNPSGQGDTRPPGGFGLHLVRALTVDRRYEYRGGRNRLVLALRP